MADYVQYHNTEKEGPLERRRDGRCAIVTNKAGLDHLRGERVWLISGSGKPRYYFVHYCFTVDRIEFAESPYSTCLEGPGARFQPAVQVDQLPWFQRLYLAKKLYSFGLQKIDAELVRELDRLREKHCR